MKAQFFAGLVTLAVSSLAFATEGRIESIQSNGSGCPVQDDKHIPYGFDGQWLTLEVNQAYNVQAKKGAGVALEEGRKNCSFIVDLAAPGYRYAVERVVTSGNAQVGAGDRFTATFEGSFQGSSATSYSTREILGATPGSQGYSFEQVLSGSNLIWSSCSNDRVLTLNTAVRVAPVGNAGNHSGTWSTGTLGRVAFRFIFQRC